MSVEVDDPDLSFRPGPLALWLIRLAGAIVSGVTVCRKVVK